jgi:hypothetical protein
MGRIGNASLPENLKKRVYLGEIRVDPHILNPRDQCKYYQVENSTIPHSASWISKQNSKHFSSVKYQFHIEIPFFWQFARCDKAILGT